MVRRAGPRAPARLVFAVTVASATALASAACARGERAGSEAAFARARAEMVARQIAARGVRDPRVLAAMRKVPRHRFVPSALRDRAYGDHPLPIGYGQTISQPYIVAFMTEALRLRPGARVLEIGTGSGYQAAVLAEIAKEVYTIEIVPPLGRRAARLLGRLGYRNVHVRIGDGYRGWPEEAPFDAIILTAAPPRIPPPLVEQLAAGGTLVAPAGPLHDQRLYRLTKTKKGVRRETLFGVRFVPMTGEAQRAGTKATPAPAAKHRAAPRPKER